jgi:hypothetical protein
MKTKKHLLARCLGVVACLTLLASFAGATTGWALWQDEQPGAGALAAVMVIYLAICLQTIARKTNTPNGWMAWIPIINIVLMLQIAQKPVWWIILFLVPLVNIVIAVLAWMGIAKAVNKPEWWGILVIVPLVGVIVPGYLAFAK